MGGGGGGGYGGGGGGGYGGYGQPPMIPPPHHGGHHGNMGHAPQPAKSAQGQQYTRIAINENHATQNSNNRQSANDNGQEPNGASLSALNQQGPQGLDQLSEENQKVLNWVEDVIEKRTGTSTGSASSFTVAMPCLG